MLLERFGLWEARGERVAAYSRGMMQRLALCRALLHDPDLVVLDEPFTALDADGAALLDQELAALGGVRTLVIATHDPDRVAALAGAASRSRERLPRRRRGADTEGPVARVARARHAAGDARLRARDARRLPLRAACRGRGRGRVRPPLGRDRLHLARRARTGLGAGGRLGAIDALVLATHDRSAIWVAKTLAALAFLAVAELVALPAFALLFAPLDAAALAGAVLASVGICVVGSLASALASAGRGREVVLPLLVLPLAIPLVVGGVGAGISPIAARISSSSGSTTRCSRYFPGPRSSTSSPSNGADARSPSLPSCSWRSRSR